MGDIHIVIQPELIFSLIIITVLSIFFILAGRKIKAADPTKRPTGIILVCETGVKTICINPETTNYDNKKIWSNVVQGNSLSLILPIITNKKNDEELCK